MVQLRPHREATNQRHPFFRLPAELRNRIYGLVVPCNNWATASNRPGRSEMSMMHICRAIRSETVPIFYGNNSFAFDLGTSRGSLHAKQWINWVPLNAIASLRKLRLTTEIPCKCEGTSRRFDAEGGMRLSITIDCDTVGKAYTVLVNPLRTLEGVSLHVRSWS